MKFIEDVFQYVLLNISVNLVHIVSVYQELLHKEEVEEPSQLPRADGRAAPPVSRGSLLRKAEKKLLLLLSP